MVDGLSKVVCAFKRKFNNIIDIKMNILVLPYMVQFDIQTAPYCEMMWFHPLLILNVMATTLQVHVASSSVSVCTIGELTCYADPAPGQGKILANRLPPSSTFYILV